MRKLNNLLLCLLLCIQLEWISYKLWYLLEHMRTDLQILNRSSCCKQIYDWTDLQVGYRSYKSTGILRIFHKVGLAFTWWIDLISQGFMLIIHKVGLAFAWWIDLISHLFHIADADEEIEQFTTLFASLYSIGVEFLTNCGIYWNTWGHRSTNFEQIFML